MNISSPIVSAPRFTWATLRQLAILCLLCLGLFAQGCAYSAYGVYDDKRMMDTIRADQTMAKSIKAALMREDMGNTFSVSVYCFYGHVFLVGEASKQMQAKALKIARSYNPASVTPHWFTKKESDRSNIALSADLRAALIGAKGLSSTRIDTEVNAGRVVLLGVVHDDSEKQLAIRIARGIKGVNSVISYLMLPQSPVQR